MSFRHLFSRLLSIGSLALSLLSPATLSGQEPRSIPIARPVVGEASQDGFRANPSLQRRYQIRKGDVIRVTVFQEPELDTTSRVNEKGSLSCPLIGAVKLAGITAEEAVAAIEAAYRDGYLVKPQVTVMVLEHTPQSFTVLGQVMRPGTYELPPEGTTSILQALGMAGGFTRLASTTRVVVKRQTVNGEELHKLDVKSMASGKESTLFMIREGDVITIPERLF